MGAPTYPMTLADVFAQLAYLRVTTNRAVASTFHVNGTAMDDWGVLVALKLGTFLVSFGYVAGYTKPAD